MTPDQVELLARWEHTAEQLEVLKTEEMRMRKILVDELGKPDKSEGAETIKLKAGWKLKITKNINYSAKRDAARALEALLPADVAAALFRWNPEVNVSTYKNALPLYRNTIQDAALAAQITEALIEAVTIKPGAPSLELIPPKEEK